MKTMLSESNGAHNTCSGYAGRGSSRWPRRSLANPCVGAGQYCSLTTRSKYPALSTRRLVATYAPANSLEEAIDDT